MSYLKKTLAILIVSILILSPLAASLVTLNWEWEANDEDVTSFRYRLNDDEWVTVDPSVTEFILEGVDEDSFYTFEIQQSYDGDKYGESATKSYGIELPKEEPVVIEEPVVVQTPVVIAEPEIVAEPIVVPEPVVVEEPEEVVVEEEVVEPVEEEIVPAPEKVAKLTPPDEKDARIEALDSNPWMAIEFLVGAGGKADNIILKSAFNPDSTYDSLRTRILPSFTFDFVYGNIKSLSEKDYLNLRAGIGFNLYKLSSNDDTVVGSDVHLGLSYNRKLDEKVTLTAGAGLSVMFAIVDISAGTEANLFYGPYVSIGGRYMINEIFSVIANAETRLLFSDVFTPYELTGIVRVGFTYRF